MTKEEYLEIKRDEEKKKARQEMDDAIGVAIIGFFILLWWVFFR